MPDKVRANVLWKCQNCVLEVCTVYSVYIHVQYCMNTFRWSRYFSGSLPLSTWKLSESFCIILIYDCFFCACTNLCYYCWVCICEITLRRSMITWAYRWIGSVWATRSTRSSRAFQFTLSWSPQLDSLAVRVPLHQLLYPPDFEQRTLSSTWASWIPSCTWWILSRSPVRWSLPWKPTECCYKNPLTSLQGNYVSSVLAVKLI